VALVVVSGTGMRSFVGDTVALTKDQTDDGKDLIGAVTNMPKPCSSIQDFTLGCLKHKHTPSEKMSLTGPTNGDAPNAKLCQPSNGGGNGRTWYSFVCWRQPGGHQRTDDGSGSIGGAD